MSRLARSLALPALLAVAFSFSGQAGDFKAGFARRDITPTKPTPMWGYGARHDALSVGVMDPLFAKAVVVEATPDRLAIVGLDLGRSPTPPVMESIRKRVLERAGVTRILMSGSHTHHGPVLELKDEAGKGKGKFDDAVAYVKELEDKLVEAICEAAGDLRDARIGWGSTEVDMNRNRHSKIEPKPRETELAVIRLDDLSGKPIALIVNFAAHPTMLEASDLRFSADYPGQMMNAVESALTAPCVFMQGSAGDLSTKTTEETRGHEAFGKALASEVLKIAGGIETTVPEKPSIKAMDEDFDFTTRMDLRNPVIKLLLARAFFPELAGAFSDEVADSHLRPHLTTVLLNGELALVGASGEFFSNHSVRLKQRCRAEKTLFFGYCNGHHLYFPTIEGAAEGGYGADQTVSWVELGGGERMMDKALINLYTMMGKFEQVPIQP
ncbi:MAG: neutral/alkaline non-lysosomal ceramidase N-terminal domain-containing protein [Candidatus Omnitrophica bacterium]|nr:hypothetical protein [bacterium]NUN95856.1 neutral/alkaline non-lysosomal ceramidase N-terminal domain-containing protein [Candidatus Omnitrophota bacterium]